MPENADPSESVRRNLQGRLNRLDSQPTLLLRAAFLADPPWEFGDPSRRLVPASARIRMCERELSIRRLHPPSRRPASGGWIWGSSRRLKSRRKIQNFPSNPSSRPMAVRVGGQRKRARSKIRLIFDQPLALRRIQLHFLEPKCVRLQQFTLHWLTSDGGNPREIVRQQWNFSPAGSTSELEDYEVNLEGASALELEIKPDSPTMKHWQHSPPGE